MAEQSGSDWLLSNAVRIPGVKVDRDAFLRREFEKKVDADMLQNILAVGPVDAGVNRNELKKKAESLSDKRTWQSSAVSFAAGVPGGAAAVPAAGADIVQFFGVVLRTAQEISYLYGENDFWTDFDTDDERVRDSLVLYCGAMFGVNGAAAAVKLISKNVAKQTVKYIDKTALTKGIVYPVLKKISKWIMQKPLTKEGLKKIAVKAIPVVGGAVSGGLTYLSMKPMGKRLIQTLDIANYDYDEEDILLDVATLSAMEEIEAADC